MGSPTCALVLCNKVSWDCNTCLKPRAQNFYYCLFVDLQLETVLKNVWCGSLSSTKFTVSPKVVGLCLVGLTVLCWTPRLYQSSMVTFMVCFDFGFGHNCIQAYVASDLGFDSFKKSKSKIKTTCTYCDNYYFTSYTA